MDIQIEQRRQPIGLGRPASRTKRLQSSTPPAPPRVPITATVTCGRSLSVSMRGALNTAWAWASVSRVTSGFERFQDIILNATGHQIAIKPHVVHLTRGDNDGAWFANLG